MKSKVKILAVCIVSFVWIVTVSIPMFTMPFYIVEKVYFFDAVFKKPQIQVNELTVQSIGSKHLGVGFYSFKRTFRNTTTLREMPVHEVIIYAFTKCEIVYEGLYKVWKDGNETVVNSTHATYKVYVWKTKRISYSTNEVFRHSDSATALQWAIEQADVILIMKGNYHLSNSITLDSYTTFIGGNFTCDATPIFQVFANTTHVTIQNVTINPLPD